MRLAIDHRLTLTAPAGPFQSVFHLLLTPPGGPTQSVERWDIGMAGFETAGRFVDGFGNVAHLVNQPRSEDEVTIHVRGTVSTRDTHGVIGRPAGEPVPALYRRLTTATKAPPALVATFRGTKESRVDVLHSLMARVGDMLGLPDETPAQTQMQADGGQSQSQTTEQKTLPAAADYAHLFIGAARALDIPARFVTGYRLNETNETNETNEPAVLHAWAEAFDDRLGWIGFDPQRQMCPTDAYVRLAVGLDAEMATVLRTVPAAEPVQLLTVSRAE
ncbi:transglutaminase family protein [Devosia sp. BK]|uniref:transglutaminase family protein n=1 Tax=Devosia sp. BK TaxID=2871706 RepID=UPI002939E06E|nr:transglutaminase family protein [Devosia sp. BK]MDV3253190.1 transglutaminase family protein [Devosia sp. BK]